MWVGTIVIPPVEGLFYDILSPKIDNEISFQTLKKKYQKQYDGSLFPGEWREKAFFFFYYFATPVSQWEDSESQFLRPQSPQKSLMNFNCSHGQVFKAKAFCRLLILEACQHIRPSRLLVRILFKNLGSLRLKNMFSEKDFMFIDILLICSLFMVVLRTWSLQ